MCVDIPAEVLSVDPDGSAATVRADDRTVRALLVALDTGGGPVNPGDWLLVHSGLAVERIDAIEALEILDAISRARAAGAES